MLGDFFCIKKTHRPVTNSKEVIYKKGKWYKGYFSLTSSLHIIDEFGITRRFNPYVDYFITKQQFRKNRINLLEI